MTIDEAIKQFKEDAEYNRADLDLEWAEENEQVAEWLEELKELRKMREDIESNANALENNGYNKAIDDLITKIDVMFWKMECSSGLPTEGATWANARRQFKMIAEQLKEGE